MAAPLLLIHSLQFLVSFPFLTCPKVLKGGISYTALLAHKLILLNWKVAHSPSHIRWIWEILYNLKLDKLRFSLKGFVKSFNSTWDPFLRHTESLNYNSQELVVE